MTRIRWIAASLAFAFALLLIALPDASAVGVGKACGGAKRCDAGLFCETPAGTCGATDKSGTCARVPTLCAMIYLPVCGCNGQTFSNDCDRRRAEVSKSHDGPCKTQR